MRGIRFPKPKVDITVYNEILQRGFEKYPERYENYQRYKDSKKTAEVDYMPVKMDIEIISKCNLRCDMCQVKTFKKQKRADDLSFEDFKQILDSQYGVFEVKLQGLGEPFLHKDFIKMVEYASCRDIWVRTSTNATVLNKNDNYKRIIDAGVGEIQFSIDSTTKITYEKIRVNANFERVIQNCKLINNYCDSLGIDKTRMWVLLQNDNFDELHRFPTFAKELGFKRLSISMDVNGWGNEEWVKKNISKNVSHKLTQEDIDKLLIQSEKLNIDLSFWNIITKYTKENFCLWPFERIYISSDKKVVPCCMIANPEIYSLGRLGDLKEIWNSQQYIQFRDAHLSENIPNVCRYCYERKEE